MPPILDHIEKTFADQYRKEIDQEENVWRSLPFFAATLALQVAALAQFQGQILRPAGWWSLVGGGLLGAVAFASLAALMLLVRSIWWSRFTYIAAEPALLAYADELEAAERRAASPSTAEDAVTTLKRELARQYAAATAKNRAINQARLRHRTAAGIATLASVMLTILLLASTIASPYGGVHGRTSDSGQPAGQGGGDAARRLDGNASAGTSAADAGGREGLQARPPSRVDGTGGGSGALER